MNPISNTYHQPQQSINHQYYTTPTSKDNMSTVINKTV